MQCLTRVGQCIGHVVNYMIAGALPAGAADLVSALQAFAAEAACAATTPPDALERRGEALRLGVACLGAAAAAAAGDAAAAARSLDAAEAAAAASATALETALASVGAGPAPQQASPCGEECTADHICKYASCMAPTVVPELCGSQCCSHMSLRVCTPLSHAPAHSETVCGTQKHGWR